jgi:mannose-6-phosphate isomerase-like protein (cupin superfamily)
MQPVSMLNAEHYLWGDGCDGWHLLRRNEASVIRERVPPGGAEARHYHSTARQFFFILEGQGCMLLPTGELVLNSGEGLEIAPQVSHQFVNRSDRDVHLLVFSVPPAQKDRINT